MTNHETIPFRDFMDGSYKNPLRKNIVTPLLISVAILPFTVIAMQSLALTGGAVAIGNFPLAIANLSDLMVRAGLVVAGTAFFAGHRAFALKMAGASVGGYVFVKEGIGLLLSYLPLGF